MDTPFDAVVVGAGPAGAATAREIASHGHRVLLLEEHAEIGEPLHCSGLVTPRTLALAGVGRDVLLNEIHGAFVILPSGNRVAIGGEGTYAVAIDRVQLDRQLVEQAQTAGATLRTGSKLATIQRCDGELELTLREKGVERRIRTRLLVGADGAQSMVARWLGVQSPTREQVVGVSVLARLAVERDDYVQVFAGNSIAPGFFGWLIPLGEGLVRIGIATKGDGRPQIHYLRTMIAAFPNVFEGLAIGRFYGGVIPLTRVLRPYGDNVLLVGDAAGQVKPTSGGGIYSGLVGASHCGPVAAEALAVNDLSAAYLRRYALRWQADLGSEFARMAALRRIFLGLSDAELERLALLLRTPALRRLVARHGDIDYPSSVLLALARARPLLAPFVKAGLLLPWERLVAS